MYHINTTIEGIAPILFNAPNLDMLNPSGGQRQKTNAQRDQDAVRRAYIDADGGLFLPGWNIKRALLNGLQVLDLRVPGSKTRRLWRFVQPMMFINPQNYFGIKDPDFLAGRPPICFLHRVPGRDSNRSATIVRRPALNAGWRLPIRITVLDDLIREQDMNDALTVTGERVGLGGWRPEYGRFKVIGWSSVPGEHPGV